MVRGKSDVSLSLLCPTYNKKILTVPRTPTLLVQEFFFLYTCEIQEANRYLSQSVFYLFLNSLQQRGTVISDIPRRIHTCKTNYYSVLNSTQPTPLVRDNRKQPSPKLFEHFMEIQKSSEELHRRLMESCSSSPIATVRVTQLFRCIKSPTIVVFVIAAPIVVSANHRCTRGLPSSQEFIR